MSQKKAIFIYFNPISTIEHLKSISAVDRVEENIQRRVYDFFVKGQKHGPVIAVDSYHSKTNTRKQFLKDGIPVKNVIFCPEDVPAEEMGGDNNFHGVLFQELNNIDKKINPHFFIGGNPGNKSMYGIINFISYALPKIRNDTTMGDTREVYPKSHIILPGDHIHTAAENRTEFDNYQKVLFRGKIQAANYTFSGKSIDEIMR